MKVRRPKPETYQPDVPASAVEAAIESERARSIRLVCGHYSDWDTDSLYRIAGTAYPRDKLWCELCGKWKLPAKPERREIPREPLFLGWDHG